MPIILDEAAACADVDIAKAAPAPAAILRNSRRFTSNVKVLSPLSKPAINIDVSGFYLQATVLDSFLPTALACTNSSAYTNG
jgi:hypothetical protein